MYDTDECVCVRLCVCLCLSVYVYRGELGPIQKIGRKPSPKRRAFSLEWHIARLMIATYLPLHRSKYEIRNFSKLQVGARIHVPATVYRIVAHHIANH